MFVEGVASHLEGLVKVRLRMGMEGRLKLRLPLDRKAAENMNRHKQLAPSHDHAV